MDETKREEWGVVAKEAIIDHFEWRHIDLPAAFWNFCIWADEDFDAILPFLDDILKQLSLNTNLMRVYPRYKQNPKAVVNLLTSPAVNTKDEILAGLAMIRPSLRCFLKRYIDDVFATEEAAMNDICGGIYPDEIINQFVTDPKVTENFHRASSTVEKRRKYLKIRFQAR